MTSSGFPNMFVMPAPGQQSVVTVNYTQIAVLEFKFVAGTIAALEDKGASDSMSTPVRRPTGSSRSSTRTSTPVPSCPPVHRRGSTTRATGAIRARDTNYGRGFGDHFGYRDLLESGRPGSERRANPATNDPAGCRGHWWWRRHRCRDRRITRPDRNFVVTVDLLVSVDGSERLPGV